MTFCDLHTHSHFSDGTDSPARLVELARERGLSAIALCDHNTVGGLPEFLAAAEGTGIEAVPGCEFTTNRCGTELHILGLFIQPEQYGQVETLLADFTRRKNENTLELLEALDRGGYHLDKDAVLARGNGWINRAHVASALRDAGYVPTVQAAFDSLLAPGGGFYVPPMPIGSLEAIRFIRSIGAVPVLAHPFLQLDEAGMRAFLPAAKEAGLAGMEVRYSKYGPETTALASRMAKEFGLVPSGGSDYHGATKPNPLGLPQVSADWLEALRP